MIKPASKRNLLPQITGALAWALFFSIAPLLEFIVLGSVIWLPLFLLCERRRIARYGFLPGAAWRFGIVAFTITIAGLAPTKHEDGRVGPFQSSSVTLAELAADHVIYVTDDGQNDSLRITIPSLAPTRRQVMQAITEQTGFGTSIFHCGNAATILFGSGGGLIKVSTNKN